MDPFFSPPPRKRKELGLATRDYQSLARIQYSTVVLDENLVDSIVAEGVATPARVVNSSAHEQ